MATSSITTEINLVVLKVSTHVDVAVPVISQGIRGRIEQGIISRFLETADVVRIFTCTMANRAFEMDSQGNSGMVHPSIGRHIRLTVGRIAMAERAVESERRD